ncbi:hypothetical protein HK097_002646, partial [Rhizophlyctis rosea]
KPKNRPTKPGISTVSLLVGAAFLVIGAALSNNCNENNYCDNEDHCDCEVWMKGFGIVGGIWLFFGVLCLLPALASCYEGPKGPRRMRI